MKKKPWSKNGQHPNSRANLIPFVKGQPSKSPGRPKNVDCLLACIRDELAAKIEGTNLTNEQMIARMLVAQASKGNLKAAEMVLSYTTSKPATSVAVSTPEGEQSPFQTMVLLMPDGTKLTPKDMADANKK